MQAIAFAILAPGLLALLMAMGETLLPAYRYWRKLQVTNPAFPPSFFDYWFRGQVTALAGQTTNTLAMLRSMPEKVSV